MTRLVVLPGMGATSRMYGRPWHALDDAVFLDWPPYRSEASLGEVAERMVAEHGIVQEEVPVGSSLGGMVAWEIASRLRTRAVGLVGSARDAAEIHPLARRLASLTRVVPLRLVQRLAGASGGELRGQFARADTRFLRAMCAAAVRWRAPAFEGRVLRIHGDRDRLIRCSGEGAVIEGAGHLVAVTHATHCVAALRALLRDAGA